MLDDFGFDYVTAQRTDKGQRTRFIFPNHLGVTDDVGGEDRGQSTLYCVVCHAKRTPIPKTPNAKRG